MEDGRLVGAKMEDCRWKIGDFQLRSFWKKQMETAEYADHAEPEQIGNDDRVTKRGTPWSTQFFSFRVFRVFRGLNCRFSDS